MQETSVRKRHLGPLLLVSLGLMVSCAPGEIHEAIREHRLERALEIEGVHAHEWRIHAVVQPWCEKLVECGVSEEDVMDAQECYKRQTAALAELRDWPACLDAVLDLNSCQTIAECDLLADCDGLRDPIWAHCASAGE